VPIRPHDSAAPIVGANPSPPEGETNSDLGKQSCFSEPDRASLDCRRKRKLRRKPHRKARTPSGAWRAFTAHFKNKGSGICAGAHDELLNFLLLRRLSALTALLATLSGLLAGLLILLTTLATLAALLAFLVVLICHSKLLSVIW
jgi:hypothetical protein